VSVTICRKLRLRRRCLTMPSRSSCIVRAYNVILVVGDRTRGTVQKCKSLIGSNGDVLTSLRGVGWWNSGGSGSRQGRRTSPHHSRWLLQQSIATPLFKSTKTGQFMFLFRLGRKTRDCKCDRVLTALK